MDDSVKKAITYLLFSVGCGIFLCVLLLKVDVMAKQVDSQVKMVSSESDWQAFQEFHKKPAAK